MTVPRYWSMAVKYSSTMTPIRLVREMGSICEYMFRLGVKDAVELFDPVVSMEFAKKEDAYDELALLPSKYGIMSVKVYIDILYIKSRIDMKLSHLASFLGRYGTNMSLKRGLCYICNFYYRKGVEYGASIDKRTGLEIYRSVGNGRKHPYLYGGKEKHDGFILCMKSECSIIENMRTALGLQSVMLSLINFIAITIKEYNEERYKMNRERFMEQYETKMGVTKEYIDDEDED